MGIVLHRAHRERKGRNGQYIIIKETEVEYLKKIAVLPYDEGYDEQRCLGERRGKKKWKREGEKSEAVRWKVKNSEGNWNCGKRVGSLSSSVSNWEQCLSLSYLAFRRFYVKYSGIAREQFG